MQKKLYCLAQRISGPSKITRPRDSPAARELLGGLDGLWVFGRGVFGFGAMGAFEWFLLILSKLEGKMKNECKAGLPT